MECIEPNALSPERAYGTAYIKPECFTWCLLAEGLHSCALKKLKEIFHVAIRTIFSDSISAPHQPSLSPPAKKNPLIFFHFYLPLVQEMSHLVYGALKYI